ncbi:MAG: hypothetical protein V3V61_06190 [Gammaproteobacteria bacterium]
MRTKLNIFQRVMLLWDHIHAYNAVHIVKVPNIFDIDKLKKITSGYFQVNNLGALSLSQNKKQLYHKAHPNIEIKVLKNNTDETTTLHQEIQKQLNTPFDQDEEFMPFRFFIIEENKAFHLGLVYFHATCAADNIIHILKQIVQAYALPAPYEFQKTLNLSPEIKVPRLLTRLKLLPLILVHTPLRILDIRRWIRPSYKDHNDHQIGYSFLKIGSEELSALKAMAKKWQVTLNDIFLTILMKAVIPHAHKQLTHKRYKIAIGSIVNIRKDVSHNKLEDLALFLSGFNTTYTLKENLSLQQLCQHISAKTEKIKKRKLYMSTLTEMKATLPLIYLFFSKRLNKLYPKYYPLWGGITNMNLNTLWKMDDSYLDYIRAVSTGPMIPLVFSITTVNDTVNISITFRKTVFSDEMMTDIIHNFSRHTKEINHV